ncbi:hypothetical protein ACIPL1_24635 [Pseudomonas sp. NPDC090202]|uniref:hypothetical protein n=1 Tax=Pseudomonas sp. NPDC090202 TaxID=3364476 RepID=UPI003824291D
MNDPLSEWRSAINDRDSLITDPEAQSRKLADLALQAGRVRQVTADELSEMLELSDAARLWALSELEEAEAIGLFAGRNADDGVQRIKGRG